MHHYLDIKDPDLKVAYGYLYSVITGELQENSQKAEDINNEVQRIAKESGSIISMLRIINARGLREMKDKNFEKAVEVFNEIEELDEIPEEAFRHAGNIINNRGASKIRGNIDVVGGMTDLITATREYYLKEKEVPRKHIEGIMDRIREAKEKLTKKH